MAGLVLELQARALEPTTSVADLLRMAKVVAVKLDLDEFLLWIDSELGGYEKLDVPSYRSLKGEMKAYSRFHGLLPVTFSNDELAALCESRNLHQKISEVQILADSGERSLQMPIPDGQQKLLRQMFQEDVEFKLIFTPIALAGIVDAVRNVILDWSLRLEKEGIRGEGMTFSKEDRAKASASGMIYQINSIENFTGNMGGISGQGVVNATTNVAIDTRGLEILVHQLEQNKGQFGLTTEMRTELEQALSNLKIELNSSMPKASKLGALLGLVKTVVQTAGSSLLVQGALFEIDKFKHLIHG